MNVSIACETYGIPGKLSYGSLKTLDFDCKISGLRKTSALASSLVLGNGFLDDASFDYKNASIANLTDS